MPVVKLPGKQRVYYVFMRGNQWITKVARALNDIFVVFEGCSQQICSSDNGRVRTSRYFTTFLSVCKDAPTNLSSAAEQSVHLRSPMTFRRGLGTPLVGSWYNLRLPGTDGFHARRWVLANKHVGTRKGHDCIAMSAPPDLQQRGIRVRIDVEATGYSR